jgi:hypothetical protein
MTEKLRRLPRELAEGVWWIGGCLESAAFETPVHFHTNAYLILGTEKTLLYDTAPPSLWPDLDRDLDRLLGSRSLDYVIPSHPEIPHAGNLDRVLNKYSKAIAIGDMRDYHLYYPDHADRMQMVAHETTLNLGGGYRFTLLDAIIEDLPTTVWGYEHKQQLLLSGDALGYGHHPQALNLSDEELADEPLHRAGECALLSSELHSPPDLHLATYLMHASLYWSRYVDITPYLERLEALMQRYPPRFIGPAHGSVIDDLDVVMPVLREAHKKAFVG